MKIRTQLQAGGVRLQNHNQTLNVRTALRAGKLSANHSEPLVVRTALKAGRLAGNHNEALIVRTAVKVGRLATNHSDSLRVRTAAKAGRLATNHNESLRQSLDQHAISMRRQPLTTVRQEDRLELLVVRAGLRAGRRARGRE